MRSPLHRFALCTSTLALAGLSACADPPVSPGGTPSAARGLPAGTHLQYGTPTKLGDGMVRTYVILDETAGRMPVEIGVAVDARAMEGTLPDESLMLPIALPAQAPAPYDFVLFDWNHHGHEPPGVYDIPHFDFHFYWIPWSEVATFLPSDPSFAAEADDVPTGGEVPPFYVLLGPPGGTGATVAVPQMGVHWADIRSPELQMLVGNPAGWAAFTKTFIYGSWAGEMIFAEPMVTRAYLLGQPDVTTVVPVPAVVPETGWYPTAYRVYYDAASREYRVAITRFVWREA